MKIINIIQCKDPMMWYRDCIGKLFPVIKEYEDEYLTRELDGYLNIVRKTDAKVVLTNWRLK